LVLTALSVPPTAGTAGRDTEMSDTPQDPEEPDAGSSSLPTAPRIRDLEEMDRRRREEARRFEARVKWLTRVLWTAVAGAAVTLAWGGWEARSRLNRVNDDLDHLREVVVLRTSTCRRHLPGQNLATATEARLVAAEQDLNSPEIAIRLRGFKQYRRLSRDICGRALRTARAQTPGLYSGLQNHTEESTRQLRRRTQLYNRHAKEYNLAVRRFPVSLARQVFRYPATLPYAPTD
jgi:hypothetical protein